ncbi:MAG: large conductance mechanosensitive channel protein MscL [Clostridia bacterium]|nr:large conductance mechanosensitive channel protein MscL [Clostridia bacterium]
MANEKPKKKGFFQEFKEFLARGNVLDLSVAVIIGAAFGAIVTSLTNDIIMPLVTYCMGANSLADLSVVLRPEVVEMVGGVETVVKEALTWNYGNFLQAILDFLIIAFVVFCFVKIVMKLKSAGEALQAKIEAEVAERVAARKAAEAEQEGAENPEE